MIYLKPRIMIGFDNDVYPNSSNLFRFPKNEQLTKSVVDLILEEKVEETYFYREDKYMFDVLNSSIIDEKTIYQFRRHYVRENKSSVCPTLTANMGTGGHNVPLIKTNYGIRKLTPRECFRFQGFPDSYIIPKIAKSHLYKQAGNSVSVPVIEKVVKNILKTINGINCKEDDELF